MTAYDDTVRGPVPTTAEVWADINRTPQQPLKVVRLHPDAVIPGYATAGSACFDLHTIWDGVVPGLQSLEFDTGLAFGIPDGHVMLIFSRSGLGFRRGIRLSNSVAVIDSDYTGCVMLKLHNDSNRDYLVKKGDRIAQAMLVPIPRVQMIEVDALGATERGVNGFGSTGE